MHAGCLSLTINNIQYLKFSSPILHSDIVVGIKKKGFKQIILFSSISLNPLLVGLFLFNIGLSGGFEAPPPSGISGDNMHKVVFHMFIDQLFEPDSYISHILHDKKSTLYISLVWLNPPPLIRDMSPIKSKT